MSIDFKSQSFWCCNRITNQHHHHYGGVIVCACALQTAFRIFVCMHDIIPIPDSDYAEVDPFQLAVASSIVVILGIRNHFFPQHIRNTLRIVLLQSINDKLL